MVTTTTTTHETKYKIKENSKKTIQTTIAVMRSFKEDQNEKSLVFEFDSLSLLFAGKWDTHRTYVRIALFLGCADRNDRMCKKGNLLWPPQV